jgi:hypothetical protein
MRMGKINVLNYMDELTINDLHGSVVRDVNVHVTNCKYNVKYIKHLRE